MQADVANVLNAVTAGAIQSSQQRTNVIGESLTQGLGVVQNLSIQTANGAISSAISMADDAQAAMGLRTAVYVPEKGA